VKGILGVYAEEAGNCPLPGYSLFAQELSSMADPAPGAIELVERNGYLDSRCLGPYSVAHFKKQLEASVQACTERKLNKLLLDITGISGYEPGELDRFEIGQFGAKIAAALSKVAALAGPEQLGRKMFEVRVARNRGLLIKGFVDRQDAVDWLTKPKSG
jgi:hypothetical protein